MKKKIAFLLRMGLKISACFIYSIAFQVWKIINPNHKRSVLLIPQNGLVGGTKYFTLALIEYLQNKNYKIALLVPVEEEEGFKAEIDKGISLDTYTNELDHQEHYFNRRHSLYKYYREKILSQQIFILKAALKKSAGIIITSVSHPGRYSATFLFPGKVLYFIHTLPWIAMDKGNLDIIHKELEKQEKNIFTVSAFAKSKIMEYWELKHKHSKIKYVHNFYQPVLKKTDVKKPDVVTILTLGNVIEDKNPQTWYEAAVYLTRKYGNEKLRFIWAGKGQLLDHYQEITKNEKAIHFIGWIKDVDTLYAESDIYIQPSYAESHGIAVVGAMAHGLPCIVTEVGGTTESVQHNINGYLCDTRNINELLFYTEKLINDPDLCKEFGNEGKRIFSEKFTKRIWEEKMSEYI